MSYARNLLSRGEEIVFETRQHWFAVFAQVWLFAILGVVALAVLLWAAGNVPGTVGQVLEIGAFVVLLGAAARIGFVIWGWQNQEYLVTTRRVIKAEGILNKAMGDSSLEKISSFRMFPRPIPPGLRVPMGEDSRPKVFFACARRGYG